MEFLELLLLLLAVVFDFFLGFGAGVFYPLGAVWRGGGVRAGRRRMLVDGGGARYILLLWGGVSPRPS